MDRRLSVILVAGFLLDLRETDGTNQTTSGTAMSSFAIASRSGVEDVDLPMARETVCVCPRENNVLSPTDTLPQDL